jgi:hypothetical protein
LGIHDSYYAAFGYSVSDDLCFSFCSFVRAKSELSVEDVSELVEIGLQIFHSSENKLYAQVRKIIPERTPATCSVSSYTLAFPFFMLTFWVIGWLWYHRLDGVMF